MKEEETILINEIYNNISTIREKFIGLVSEEEERIQYGPFLKEDVKDTSMDNNKNDETITFSSDEKKEGEKELNTDTLTLTPQEIQEQMSEKKGNEQHQDTKNITKLIPEELKQLFYADPPPPLKRKKMVSWLDERKKQEEMTDEED